MSERVAGRLMSTDKLSNLISALKNATMAGKAELETGYFKQGKEVLDILKHAGLLAEVKVFKQEETGFKGLHVDFVKAGELVRKLELARLSKPGHRVYGSYKEFMKVKAGLGALVVSTSRGMLTGDEAKKRRLGGELICKAYFE